MPFVDRIKPGEEQVDRSLLGWRLRTPLVLDELPPWTGDDRTPDVVVSIGSFPDTVQCETHRGPFLTIGSGGVCHVNIPEVARYSIEDGHSVMIDPILPVDAPDIRTFLLGSVLGILCHQRGLLPLHASAVQIGDTAVAFAGQSGAGKSTLAATLVARGHRLLADDIVAVDTRALSGPMMLPSFSRMKLWRDSLSALGAMQAGLTRVRSGLEKFQIAVPEFDTSPVRLTSVYGLATARPSFEPGIRRLSGHLATAVLSNNIYRANVAQMIGKQGSVFEALIRLARGAQTWMLIRPQDLGALDELAQLVEAHVMRK